MTWSTGSRCWWTQGVPPEEMSNPRLKMCRARQEEGAQVEMLQSPLVEGIMRSGSEKEHDVL